MKHNEMASFDAHDFSDFTLLGSKRAHPDSCPPLVETRRAGRQVWHTVFCLHCLLPRSACDSCLVRRSCSRWQPGRGSALRLTCSQPGPMFRRQASVEAQHCCKSSQLTSLRAGQSERDRCWAAYRQQNDAWLERLACSAGAGLVPSCQRVRGLTAAMLV